MSNPAAFIQACNDGRIWLHCSRCNEPKNYNAVEHLETIENPSYWGADPWWYETRVFKCPDCETTQQSSLHVQD